MARRNEQEPTEKPGMHAHHDSRSKTYQHPAFGQVGVSRITGATTLYGSDFMHQTFVALRIHRSELNRDLSRDWHFERQQLIEVHLSEAQWATLVSSFNMGSGVPCTLSRVMGEQMPGIPLRVQEDEYEADFNATTRSAVERIDRAIQQVQETLGSSLSQKKRDELLGHLKMARQDLESNIPFVAQSFAKHMENTVEKAKTEVNAYVQQSVMRAGLNTLQGADNAPLQLGAGTPIED